MNPLLVFAGVAGLLAYAKTRKGGTAPTPMVKPMETDVQVPTEVTAPSAQVTAPPADVLVEDTRAEEVKKTVDANTSWTPSVNETTVSSDVVAEVVDADDSWTPNPAKSTPVASPAPPKVSETPIKSPAPPKVSETPVSTTKDTDPNTYNTDPTLKDPQTGLSLLGANVSGKTIFNTADGGRMIIRFNKNYPYLNPKEISQFKKLANSYGVGEPIKIETGKDGFVRQFGGFGSFQKWLLGQTGFTKAQAGSGKLAGGPLTRRIYLLGKQKGLLNVETIKKYIQYRDKQVAEYKAELQKSKERASKPKPKVFAGKVLDENGNYVSPTSKESCPIGYKFLDSRGTKRCLTPERYAEIMVERSRDVHLLPLRLTYWEGTRKGVKVQNNRLFSKYITFKEGQFANLVKGYGLTSADSLKGLTDYFEHRGVFWGKKDGKWVALYEVKVQLNNGKKVRRYVVYNVTKDEYDYYKDVSKYYQIFLKNKGVK